MGVPAVDIAEGEADEPAEAVAIPPPYQLVTIAGSTPEATRKLRRLTSPERFRIASLVWTVMAGPSALRFSIALFATTNDVLGCCSSTKTR